MNQIEALPRRGYHAWGATALIVLICCVIAQADVKDGPAGSNIRFVSVQSKIKAGAEAQWFDRSHLTDGMINDLNNLVNALVNARRWRDNEWNAAGNDRNRAFQSIDQERDNYIRTINNNEQVMRDIAAEIVRRKADYTNALQSDINRSRQELAALQQAVAQLQREIQDINTRNAQVIATIKADADNRVGILDATDAKQVQEHNLKIEELERIAHATTERLNNELNDLNSKFETMTADIETAKTATARDIAELEKVQKELADKTKETEETLAALQADIVKIIADGDEKKAAIAAEIAELEASVGLAKIAADAEVKDIRENIDGLIANLTTRYQQLNAELTASIETAHQDIKKYQAEVAEFTQQELKSKQELANVKITIEETHVAGEAARLRFEEEQHKLQAQIEDFKASIGPLLKRIEEAKAAAAAAAEKQKAMEEAAAAAAAAVDNAVSQAKDARAAVDAEAETARKAALEAAVGAEEAERKKAAVEKAEAKAKAEAEKQMEDLQRDAKMAQNEAERAKAAAEAAAAHQKDVAADLNKQLAAHAEELKRKEAAEKEALDKRNSEALNQADSVTQNTDNLMMQQRIIDGEIADVVNRTSFETLQTAQLRTELTQLEDKVRTIRAEAAAKTRDLQSSFNALQDEKDALEAKLQRKEEELAKLEADNANGDDETAKKDAAASADIAKTGTAIADITRQMKDLEALMTQAVKTGGGSNADMSLGAVQAVADIAQQLSFDAESLHVEKESSRDMLAALKRRVEAHDAKRIALEAEVNELEKRVGVARQQSGVNDGVSDNDGGNNDPAVSNLRALQREKQQLLRDIAALEGAMGIAAPTTTTTR